MTPLQQKLNQMAGAAAASFGVQLVLARLGSQSGVRAGRSTLQVLLENPDGSSPDVEICAQVSRLLSAQLDVAELIGGKYILEVSSAGLDRPLLSAAECARFVGKGAAVKFKTPLEFKGKPLGAAKGVLQAVAGDEITLLFEGLLLTFNFQQVYSAELAPTEAELAAFMGFNPKPKRGTPHPLSMRAKQLKPNQA
jgi:ribosome maturation factor RimP